MTEYADLAPDGDPVGLAVVLPGRGYTVDVPLLHFTAGVLRDRGWRVRLLRWVPPDPDAAGTAEWVAAELAAAVGDHDGPVLVVGKSLGGWAASYVADRSWPAIWLTPVLSAEPVADGVRRNTAAQLLVVGSADDVAGAGEELTEELPADVLEVAGADHFLEIPGDAVASAAALGDVVAALDQWLDDAGVTGA